MLNTECAKMHESCEKDLFLLTNTCQNISIALFKSE